MRRLLLNRRLNGCHKPSHGPMSTLPGAAAFLIVEGGLDFPKELSTS